MLEWGWDARETERMVEGQLRRRCRRQRKVRAEKTACMIYFSHLEELPENGCVGLPFRHDIVLGYVNGTCENPRDESDFGRGGKYGGESAYQHVQIGNK